MRLLFVACLLASPLLLAATKEERTWNELQGLTNRNIRITMPQGAVITGNLTAVQSDGLVMQITKTTDKKSYPKGRFLAPRSQVKVLSVLSKGRKYRVIGTICGAWVGLSLGVYAAIHTDSAGAGLATLGAVGVGTTVAGYFAGDAADNHNITIYIKD